MRHLTSTLVLAAVLSLSLSCQAPPQTGGAAEPPPSPTAADGIAYQVAYVEVLPASRQEAIGALQAYRDASRREAGGTHVDIFEQVGRDAHFAVLETWTSIASRDSHVSAAHTRAMHDTLARIGASGYDERPYKTLSVAPPRPDGAQAIHLISHVDTIPGSDAAALIQRLAEASRAEEGNLRYDVFQHAIYPNHFTLVESWANQAAVDAHVAAAHTRQYRLDIQPMTGSPLDARPFRLIE